MSAFGQSVIDESVKTEMAFMKSVSELLGPKRPIQDILVDIVNAHRADIVAQRRAAVAKTMRAGLVCYTKAAALEGADLVDTLDAMISEPMFVTSAEYTRKELAELAEETEPSRHSKRARRL